MRRRRAISRLVPACVLIGAATLVVAQDDTDPPVVELTPEQVREVLLDIGAQLVAASPKASPDDQVARDKAAGDLGRVSRLIDAGGERVAWGVMTEAGTPVEEGVQVHPLALVKPYLSLFAFEGTPQTSTSEGRSLLEVPAAFRDRLRSSEYPEPLWATPEQWGSYTRTKAVVFVFEGDRLISVMRRLGPARDDLPARKGSSRWEWTDIRGRPQPRVAQLEYLLDAENPELVRTRDAWTALNASLRDTGCMTCHAPDSALRRGYVTRFHSPVAALSVSVALPELLQRTDLGKDDPHANRDGGIANDEARAAMLKLAVCFRDASGDALAYEAARRAASDGAVTPAVPSSN